MVRIILNIGWSKEKKMLEDISVDYAIKKGVQKLTYVGVVILSVLLILCIVVGTKYQLPAVFFPVGFVVAFVTTWIYWSVNVTRWKVWAFNTVRNVHELKERAIEMKLIWPDGSIWNKTEIWRVEDKMKWVELQNKFLKEDVIDIEDDASILSETKIYYSKAKNLISIIYAVIMFAVGIVLIVYTKTSFLITGFGVVLIVVSCYSAYHIWKVAKDNTPQIIINEKGMQATAGVFYNWNEIKHEDVEFVFDGNTRVYYLVFEHPDGRERTMIDKYDIDYSKLRQLLKIYRLRSTKV